MQAFRLRRVCLSTNSQQAESEGIEPSRLLGQRIFNCNLLQHSQLVPLSGLEPEPSLRKTALSTLRVCPSTTTA